MNYDYLPDLNGITTNDFSEYNNALLFEDYRTAAIADSELAFLKNDNEDFTEFRWVLQGETENLDNQPQYYDLQRMLTIEKGEDRYNHLYLKKKREYQATINSHLRKQQIQEAQQYFTVGDANKYYRKIHNDSQLQFAGRQWRVDDLADAQERQNRIRKKKKEQKLIGYKFENSPNFIKEKLKRLWENMEKNETRQSTQDSVLQIRDDQPTKRERAYSQQNFGDHDEMMDAQCEVEAYSQHQPHMKGISEGGNETESENDSEERHDKQQEKEDKAAGSTLITTRYHRNALKGESTISLFHQYLMWFKMHSVDHIEEEQPEAEVAAPVEVKQQPVKPVKYQDRVEAHGKGKSGFIEIEMKDEQEKVPEAKVEPEVILETKPSEPELVMEVEALHAEAVFAPEVDQRDYKEGKTTQPKTMKDLLTDLAVEQQNSANDLDQQLQKTSSVSPPPSQVPAVMTIDDLLDEPVFQPAKTESPKKNQPSYNLSQRKIVGPPCEPENASKSEIKYQPNFGIAIEPTIELVQEERNEIIYQEDSSDYDDSDEDGNFNKSVGTQLMNNESIGLSQPSPDASYEHSEDLSAAELAVYASASLEKQQALDSGIVTIADVRRESEDYSEKNNETGDFGRRESGEEESVAEMEARLK